MTHLLDANVLIALTNDSHVHHELVESWFSQQHEPFCTCPITQGAAVRQLLRQGASASQAQAVLASVADDPRHVFLPDDLRYAQVDLRGVIGHKQVTDAYLAALARASSAQLITLDIGLAALHPDVAVLLGATHE